MNSRTKEILLSILLLILSFQSFAELEDSFSNYQKPKTIYREQYIIGGIFGTMSGFGIGHAVQGRYTEKGWIFTMGGLSLLAGFSGAVYFGFGASYQPDNKLLFGAAYTSLGVLLIGMGLKIWEVVDVWMLPSHYKVVKEKAFQVKPLAFYDTNNQLHYGLSLNYLF